jgi:hypothetical protein
MVSEHATDMSSFIENICFGYLLRRIRAAEIRAAEIRATEIRATEIRAAS